MGPRSALVGLVGLLFACTPIAMRDPGHLEVHNWLRDDLVAWVGGRPVPVAACTVLQLDGVELHGLRVTTPGGTELFSPDAADDPPVGPTRYLVVGGPWSPVADMRTRPNGGRPNGVCEWTLEEILRQNPAILPGQGVRP
jgi:hypothetical protein